MAFCGEGPVDGKGDTRSDVELVAAVNDGDWPAFDALYYRYKDWTFRLAWRFCGNETDAADTVQEVFVYLAGKFRGGGGGTGRHGGLELKAGLTSLLYPAVKHTALALKRKRMRLKLLPEEIDIPQPPPGAEASAARAELASVLRGLSDAHREVLLMRFVDDMTLEQIATALAIPLGTAKSRLHHALAGVREDARVMRHLGAVD
jgi:RNA polymerase sigma-70 factor, ECF subfamily